VRRLGRRLQELGAIVAPLERPTDVDADVERTLTLEASGWKGRRGTAILNDPVTAQFYRDVARTFAKRDELRLSTISLEGELVAFDLCIVANGRLWIPKGGIDEQHRRLSPGIVLLVAEIEAALDDGASGVELLGDADAYKLPFATRTRRHGTLHGARLRPLPVARLAYRRAVRPRLRRAAKALGIR
jgi:CelD/BcsL family acetyltransferase involved in cellulose biosynthesis